MLTGSPISSMNTSPPLRHRRGLQHQAHRLLDAHEVAGHRRVGHGDGTARRDLPDEGRDDAAPAAEHVAEPHRAHHRPAVACRLRTICSANHFDAPITLAGRTALSVEIKHEALAPHAAAASTTLRGAEHVGPDGLRGVRLEHRDVLVRGGVEDHLGTVVRKTRRGRGPGRRRRASAQATRREGPRPAITSCRCVSSWSSSTSSAGSNARTWRTISEPIDPPAPVIEDAPAGEHVSDDVLVHLDLLSAEEVLDLEVPDVADGHPAIHDLVDGREDRQGQTCASSHDAATLWIRSRVADGIASST